MKEALKNFKWKSKLEQGIDHVLELNKSFVVPAGQKHELQITEDFQAVVIMEIESEIKFINN